MGLLREGVGTVSRFVALLELLKYLPELLQPFFHIPAFQLARLCLIPHRYTRTPSGRPPLPKLSARQRTAAMEAAWLACLRLCARDHLLDLVCLALAVSGFPFELFGSGDFPV